MKKCPAVPGGGLYGAPPGIDKPCTAQRGFCVREKAKVSGKACNKSRRARQISCSGRPIFSRRWAPPEALSRNQSRIPSGKGHQIQIPAVRWFQRIDNRISGNINSFPAGCPPQQVFTGKIRRGKCSSAMTLLMRRLISPERGYFIPVRKPASTCPTGILW